MGLFGSGKKGQKTEQTDKQDHQSDKKSVSLSDGHTYTIVTAVDCLGDSCPRPQLMTKKAVTNSGSGDVVAVLVDNPTSMEALPPMCAALSAKHLETVPCDQGWHVYIQKN